VKGKQHNTELSNKSVTPVVIQILNTKLGELYFIMESDPPISPLRWKSGSGREISASQKKERQLGGSEVKCVSVLYIF
jgi:hypothetical protein